VAVIGSGYWGKNLVRNFHELGALHTVCDNSQQALRQIQEKYPEVSTTEGFQSVLKDPDIQAVVLTESNELDEAAREDIYAILRVLNQIGPKLGRPYVDSVQGSQHSNLKELRVQSKGRPLRIFFVFDKKRRAVLLVGGNKAGNKRFYDQMVPLADKALDDFLESQEDNVSEKK
jgi:hypothetical protein